MFENKTPKAENPRFLTEQIITYIGNKRKLLPYIDKEIENVYHACGGKKLVSADIFSDSGIVSRLLKQRSKELYVNDLELYSAIINRCYLSNYSDFNRTAYEKAFLFLQDKLNTEMVHGIITENYAPQNNQMIQSGERVFYTVENAGIIDTLRINIEKINPALKDYFLAPLLYQASVQVNTGGIFKGFYKNPQTGIVCFGGAGQHALKRITKPICILKPVFSNYACETKISQQDANTLIHSLPELDFLYIDPPYNQHPYGSNYFMLNIIAENKITAPLSRVSGIPNNWNRSGYNKRQSAPQHLASLIAAAQAKFILVSYNSEGFIAFDDMKQLLETYGKVNIIRIPYTAYRASRNLKNRNIHLHEYLFKLEKT
ncbi:MAG: DNA adenine methylase [Treponema phagedenis]|uniref:DNA adenine methylase n=1 Tax=Treponema phagedenis TaxID=162 RepID=UPI0004652572|nr:DNA adenine methylase [Treponema phagedenis]